MVEDRGDGGLVIGGLGVYRPSGPDTLRSTGHGPASDEASVSLCPFLLDVRAAEHLAESIGSLLDGVVIGCVGKRFDVGIQLFQSLRRLPGSHVDVEQLQSGRPGFVRPQRCRV